MFLLSSYHQHHQSSSHQDMMSMNSKLHIALYIVVWVCGFLLITIMAAAEFLWHFLELLLDMTRTSLYIYQCVKLWRGGLLRLLSASAVIITTADKVWSRRVNEWQNGFSQSLSHLSSYRPFYSNSSNSHRPTFTVWLRLHLFMELNQPFK